MQLMSYKREKNLLSIDLFHDLSYPSPVLYGSNGTKLEKSVKAIKSYFNAFAIRYNQSMQLIHIMFRYTTSVKKIDFIRKCIEKKENKTPAY